MIKHNFLFISLTVLLFGACRNSALSDLEKALETAGNNRTELEKVLKLYSQDPSDSLKYKAACFLIANMPGLYAYEDGMLDHYLGYYKELRLHKNKTPAEILGMIEEKYGKLSPQYFSKKYDIQEIDSVFLCTNIEYSFKVWKEYPWCQQLSFDEFCEQILPYRLQDEKLENWRPVLYARYAPLMEKLKTAGNTNPIEAARILTDSLKRTGMRFTMAAPLGIPSLGPTYGQYLTGNCQNITEYVIYACRALGIPCSIDFTPMRSDANSGHLWTVYYDNKKNLYIQDFLGEIQPLAESRMQKEIHPSKVYRYTFALNRKMSEELSSQTSKPFPLFNQPRFLDVTSCYTSTCLDSLIIPESQLYRTKSKAPIAYLCHARRQDWIPVAWTPMDKHHLVFHSINKGNLARVATFENNRFIFLTPPFYIGEEPDKLTFYTPSTEKEEVILLAKTNLNEERRYFRRMVNGIFEGSDTPDFKQKEILFRIDSVPERLMSRVSINASKPYRYVRYYGADSTNCNVAEIVFYEGSTKLSGKVIGTPGCWQRDSSHEYTKAFDGSTTTSFDYKFPCGGWCGLDLGIPHQITQIVYTPRNRDNFIHPGDTYELFYQDKDWISLGKVTPNTDSLSYSKVPKNALLYLKNHSRGYDERVFLYENGQQVWK